MEAVIRHSQEEIKAEMEDIIKHQMENVLVSVDRWTPGPLQEKADTKQKFLKE
jgi:hypothetical protein